MKHVDVLYGSWQLPQLLNELVRTPLAARMRGISQDVIPDLINPAGCMPSRFDHGLGAAHLANLVEANLDHEKTLLPKGFLTAAAFLHDAGNPPFSHLSEPLLGLISKHDGETFLEELIDQKTLQILNNYGIEPSRLLRFIAGGEIHLSRVLSGSMDLDNLDNIARYAAYTGLTIPDYNGPEIARSLRFWRTIGWNLDVRLRVNCLAWQEARRKVYSFIYDQPHINAVAMLNRAMDLAFINGDLGLDFFKLNDAFALRRLRVCNSSSNSIIEALWQRRLYNRVFSFETTEPSRRLQGLTQSLDLKIAATNNLCSRLDLPQENLCLLVSRGRDLRVAKLSFRGTKSMRIIQEKVQKPVEDPPAIYRGMIFISPDIKRRATAIKSAAEDYIL